MNVVGENLGQTCGNVIARSYEWMAEIKPDALLVLGDTNSCLSAISAKRLHIPISIWKPVTDVRMSACRKRRIAGL